LARRIRAEAFHSIAEPVGHFRGVQFAGHAPIIYPILRETDSAVSQFRMRYDGPLCPARCHRPWTPLEDARFPSSRPS
jgi:hypothetical protein